MDRDTYNWRRTVDIVAIAFFSFLSLGSLIGGSASMCIISLIAIVLFASSLDYNRAEFEKAEQERLEKEKELEELYIKHTAAEKRYDELQERVAKTLREAYETNKKVYFELYGQEFKDLYNTIENPSNKSTENNSNGDSH